MATSYHQLFLWMASLVALSHSECTIQVQVFSSKYFYSSKDNRPITSDFIQYNDEACQSESESLISCSGTPKLLDCDLGPDNGLPSDTTESFYSLNLTKQHFFSFAFSNPVNLTALTLHYYCTTDIQLQGNTFCVMEEFKNFTMCLPCVSSHRQRETLRFSYEIEHAQQLLKVMICSDYSSQLHISEIHFFTEVSISDSSVDKELRILCLASISDVPPTCDHWWVDYNENVTLDVHDRKTECGNINTSSVCVDKVYTESENGTHNSHIVVTFKDDCSERSTVSLNTCVSTELPMATGSSSLPTGATAIRSSVLPTGATAIGSSVLPTGATGSSVLPTSARGNNAGVIAAGVIVGSVVGLTLCAIVILIFVIYCLSRGKKEGINRIFLRKRNNYINPLNVRSRSDPIEGENTVADTQPFDGVSNPVYLPNACGHAESQVLGTTQNPSTAAGQEQPLVYEEVKNRDHSRIKDHTQLHANGREDDSQLNSEPTYSLATPSVIQIDPTYSRLDLSDTRAAANEEQDPAYQLDHKTTATVQDPAYSHLDHTKTTATVQDPAYSHLDHKTATVKQDPTYSHIHHRLTAEEQTSALADEYAHLDCKTATQKPAPASADYSHIKFDRQALTEQQDSTSS